VNKEDSRVRRQKMRMALATYTEAQLASGEGKGHAGGCSYLPWWAARRLIDRWSEDGRSQPA
jgi:hypothetical protein